jgi:hypothetical protein
MSPYKKENIAISKKEHKSGFEGRDPVCASRDEV